MFAVWKIIKGNLRRVEIIQYSNTLSMGVRCHISLIMNTQASTHRCNATEVHRRRALVWMWHSTSLLLIFVWIGIATDQQLKYTHSANMRNALVLGSNSKLLLIQTSDRTSNQYMFTFLSQCKTLICNIYQTCVHLLMTFDFISNLYGELIGLDLHIWHKNLLIKLAVTMIQVLIS